MRKDRLAIRVGIVCLALILLMSVAGGCTDEPTHSPTQTPTSTPTQTSTPAPTPEPEEVIKWDLQAHLPRVTPVFQQAQMFVDRVNEVAEGRLEITLFAVNEIVPAGQELDALQSGALIGVIAGTAPYAGKLGPASSLFQNVPAGPNIHEYMAWYYERDGNAAIQELYSNAGIPIKVVGAPVAHVGAEVFGWYVEPLTSLEDFEGMKFRTMGLWGEIVQRAGASVVNLPGGEVYQSFERGIIDGFEFGTPAMDWSMGFQDLNCYMHLPGIHTTHAATNLLINTSVWDQVPDNLKDIITLATYACENGNAFQERKDIEAMEQFIEYGTKIVILPDTMIDDISGLSEELFEEKSSVDPFFDKYYHDQQEFYEKLRTVIYNVTPSYDHQPKYSLQ